MSNIVIDRKEYRLIDFDNELTYKQLQKGRELFATAFKDFSSGAEIDISKNLNKLTEFMPIYEIEIKLLALIYIAENEVYTDKEFAEKVKKFEALPMKVIKEKAGDIHNFFLLLSKSFQENFLTYTQAAKAKKKS